MAILMTDRFWTGVQRARPERPVFMSMLFINTKIELKSLNLSNLSGTFCVIGMSPSSDGL